MNFYTSENSRNLSKDKFDRYQDNLDNADETTIEVAKMLQQAAGINIGDKLAPLYIDQAVYLKSQPFEAGQLAAKLWSMFQDKDKN